MNRFVAAIFFGVVGSLQIACASSGVGDPCTPEAEFGAADKTGAAVLTDISVDLNSTQCDTRVCLSHFFQGRVTCPYGNSQASGQKGECKAVPDLRGLYTLDGTQGGTLCCPVVGDVTMTPIQNPVPGQCANRGPADSVYCSCRCDVPAGIDKSTVKLCSCPSGYSCVPLLTNKLLPEGKQGSYCVKDGANGSDLGPDTDPSVLETACGGEKPRP
jgi:hypothetical protein